ncbi:MAG: hypothetical protein ACXAEN_23170 [Candidatus Thorarchaeota archaeon]|jgi:RecA/RadA recombinase
MGINRRHVQQIEEEAESPAEEIHIENKGNFEHSVSTGSTLLDLAISGGKVKGGGICGGIVMEIFGPPSAGKTAILSEICTSAQNRGGKTRFLDPEARLVAEYARIYGVDLTETDYHRPDTVNEVFDLIRKWDPPEAPKGGCNVILTDSLAALSSEAELSEKGDKMAGRRIALMFNEGLRKTCRQIRHNNWLIACSNQVRAGDFGETTPGGKGIPFYSSLRMRIAPPLKDKHIVKKIKVEGKEHEKVIGIRSIVEVRKSSIDDPYRKAEVYILFNYGIDDIRGNLQWLKTARNRTMYQALDKEFKSLRSAISYIEENNLEQKLRETVIEVWNEIDYKFREKRKEKERR